MNELDRKLHDAYVRGYEVGYLDKAATNPYPLSDLSREWRRGYDEGWEARKVRIAVRSKP